MQQEIQVLIAEDNPDDAALVVRELGRAGIKPNWHRVDTEEEFLSRLNSSLDIILCDFDMPQFNAPRALELLKDSGLIIPFIIVSGTIGEDVAVEAMKQGAADYLLKDRLARLGPAVRQAMEQSRLRRQRIQAEDTLRESEERLRLLIEGARDYAIYMLDPMGTIMTWNTGAEKILGYTAGEAIGQNFAIFYPQEEIQKGVPLEHLRLTVENGRLEDEGWRVKKDGTRFWANGVIAELSNGGKERGFCKIVRDLTIRRKLEDQLLQAQKMEAFGQLAGGVAHDFNNLLTVIDGYSNLLLETLEPQDPNRETVEFIQAAGDRAVALTRQLLAFSRVQVLEPRFLNLNEIVVDLEKMLRRLIGEDVSIVSQLDPVLKSVKADPGQIWQVVMNLAVNARDAMPQGGQITIQTYNVEWDELKAIAEPGWKPGRYVALLLADTGEGMTAAVKARIFEPFFTTKMIGKGTGLGLATAFGIVDQTGGYITVESTPGKGTTFYIYLPTAEAQPVTPQTLAADLKRYNGNETILIVEDENSVRSITALMLKKRGYTVIQAPSGKQALDILESYPGAIDVLLTDVVMPEMSGRQLLETIRERMIRIRVLYMSGYTDDAILRHGILQAEEAFIQKPFTAMALAKKIREVLDT